MENTFIYTLTDPETLQIRYVGKTDNPHRRLLAHKRQCVDNKTHCKRWIATLNAKSLAPTMSIIEEVSKDAWEDKERYWIQHYRALGADLTNITRGGGRKSGCAMSEEHRQKLIKIKTGVPLSDSHKISLSNAAKRKFRETDAREKLSRRWASLTDEQARAVYKEARYCLLTHRQISQKYGIPTSSVSEILNGKAYQHAVKIRPTEPVIDARRVRGTERVLRIIEMRKKGINWEQIAKTVGVRVESAKQAVRKSAKEGSVQAAEVMRQKVKRVITEEQRRKLSESHKGIKPTPETIAKRSESLKRAHARRREGANNE